MKTIVKNYQFNAATKRITFLDYDYIDLNDILLITNVTQNKIIYNFAKPGFGANTGPGANTITLQADTTGMGNGDSLQIIVDIAPKLVNLSNSGFFTATTFPARKLLKLEGFSAYGQEQFLQIWDDSADKLIRSVCLKPWSNFEIEFTNGVDVTAGLVGIIVSSSPTNYKSDMSAGTIRANALII